MSAWPRVKLGDVCSRVFSGGTPSRSNSTFFEKGNIPWLNTGEIKFQDIYSTENCITQAGYDKSAAKWVEPNSVIIAMYGATAGKACITRIRLTTNQACCNLQVNDKVADYRFVYYTVYDNYLKLASLAKGGAQQNLNAQVIKDFEILLSPLPIQHRIASILSDYDSAIANARKQIELLEEAAMRLYREWFVDGSMQNVSIGDLIESTKGGSWGSGDLTAKTKNEVVCLRGADFEEISRRGLGKRIRRFVSDKHFVERRLHDGDLVVEMSGGSPTQSTGRIISVSDMFLARYGVPVLATNFCKVICPKKDYSRYLYLAWKDLYASKTMFNYEIGTTGIKNFDYDLFISDVKIPLPDRISEFNIIVSDLFSEIDIQGLRVQALTEARDRLLPKLMSGEIDVMKGAAK